MGLDMNAHGGRDAHQCTRRTGEQLITYQTQARLPRLWLRTWYHTWLRQPPHTPAPAQALEMPHALQWQG